MYIKKSNGKGRVIAVVSGVAVCAVLVIVGVWFFLKPPSFTESYSDTALKAGNGVVTTALATTSGISQASDPGTGTIPTQMLLPTTYYVSQTFNNCGPSALSMDMSFFGISASQQTIADDVRPDNNLTGKDDDKSTTPDQLVQEAEKYGLIGYFRPNGNINLLEQFIANGIPVMTRSLLNTSEDYAHYRVIKGYNQTTGTIIDEDGFQGPNITFTYNDFLAIWKPFNYEYMVMAEPSQQALVEKILAENANDNTAWSNAVTTSQAALAENPNDIEAGFNLSVALYYTGDYQGSVDEYQKVAPSLTKYALWYQIEPIESYYELGNYSEVFSLTNSILNNGNPAFPELYVLQGESYEKEGDTAQAKQSFEEALSYNKNLPSAQQALASLN